MKDKRAYFFIGMGFELVGIILVTLYLGQIIDDKYSLGGIAIVFFTMGGLLGWITHLMWFVKRCED